MKKIFCFGLVTGMFLFFTASSFAKLSVTPSVALRETYNDNIFLTESDEEDDFITTVSPHISLNYGLTKYLDLNLDYGLNFRFYSSHSDLNDESLRETQSAIFQTQIRPLNRVFIDLSDVYERVPVDVRDRVALENFNTNMTDSNTFSISPYVEIPLTPTLLSRIGYHYTNIWYKVDKGNDSESNSGYVLLTKKFPFRVNVSLNYDYVAYRPERTGKHDSHQASVAADYQVGPNLNVWGEIGQNYLEFADSSDADSTVWDVGFLYRLGFWRSATVSARYSASISETENDVSTYLDASGDEGIESSFVRVRNSVTTGVTKTEQVDLYLKAGKDIDIAVNPFYRESDELKTSRVDKATGVSIDIGKPLTTKLSFSFDGSWERQRFFPENDELYKYSLGTGFDYILSGRITTELGYRYNKRDSRTNDDDNYDNNIVSIEAKLTF